MNEIRRIQKKEIDDFASIIMNAYPSAFNELEKCKKVIMDIFESDERSTLFGYFRKGKLLGGMRCLDFRLNLYSRLINAGGVGLVATHFLHKKEKVCRELILHFLNLYREKEYSLVLLYPFRPDFYRKMGFGYGTKMNQYRIEPKSFPFSGKKEYIKYATGSETESIIDCYNDYAKRKHGMILKSVFEVEKMFKKGKQKTVLYKPGNKVEGYINFGFETKKNENFLKYDMLIKEFIYLNRNAFSELISFIYTQLDQVDRVIINTQDENFHFVPVDPRNDSDNIFSSAYSETNIQGVGVMYRIINIEKFIDLLPDNVFNRESVRLSLNIEDSFLPVNSGKYLLQFNDENLKVKKGEVSQIEIKLDISDLSSLLMGCVDFGTLYDYNLADISDEKYVESLDSTFKTEQLPVCMTGF